VPNVEMRDENNPSLARSDVGLVMDGGENNFLPLPEPAIIRMLMIYP
jgi:hypothetical protein